MSAPVRPPRIDGDREQDVGRTHTAGAPRVAAVVPSRADRELLERYRAALRAELEQLLDELVVDDAGRLQATGQLQLGGSIERPALDVRRALWELSIKLSRELAGGIAEVAPPDPAGVRRPASSPASRGRAPRLGARERRQLGAD